MSRVASVGVGVGVGFAVVGHNTAPPSPALLLLSRRKWQKCKNMREKHEIPGTYGGWAPKSREILGFSFWQPGKLIHLVNL